MKNSRAALITGSGKNIGRAIALRLAQDGVNIILNGSSNEEACRKTSEEIKKYGVDTLIAMGDIGIKTESDKIIDKALKKFGSIDILVNNAAIRPSIPFLKMTLNQWNRVLAVNLNASFWLSQRCLPLMIKKKWGRIVNFAGMNAIHGYKGRAHVSVSKHGNWGLTKALAKEFGLCGITTNIISPGPIKSEHEDPEMTAHIESMKRRVPIGRLGAPAEIAAAVSLLTSNDGAFINGQIIQINGGTET
jgi:3-oxoacyl-[acyl-carrier protein] reductase